MNEIFTFHGMTFTAKQPGDNLSVSVRFSEKDDLLTVSFRVKNIGEEACCVKEIPLFDNVQLEGHYAKTYSECRDLLGELGINDAAAERISFGILGYTDDFGREAVLLGFDDFRDFFYKFVSVPTEGGYSIRIMCDLQGICIAPGDEAALSDMTVRFAPSVSALLQVHARRIAERMGASYTKKPLGMGWCSWYYYYGTEDRDKIFENMEQFLSSPLGKDMGFILIDDGWNQRQNNVCVWGDWTAGYKFPEGMKDVCDRIHRAGLRAGIWLAPFAVSTKSELYAAHPDWVIGGEQDILNPNEGVLGLDLSNPAVLAYIREVFDRVFNEWGYDLVKIDFLQYAVGEGKRYDNRFSGVQAFRNGLKIIRECAGDKIVLNCGSPVLQSVGLCDAMRIGSDVGSRWYFPLNEGGWPYGNCNIKSSVRYTVFRNWMHGVLWSNDPDCLVVREKSNRIEFQQFRQFFPYMEIREEDFGLSDSEAALWVKLVAFTGGIRYLSERWDELPPSRQELVSRYAENDFGSSKLVDYYVYHDVFVLQSDLGKVGIFNISDEEVTLCIPAETLGKTGETLTEIDSGKKIELRGDTYVFHSVKARSGYIFE